MLANRDIDSKAVSAKENILKSGFFPRPSSIEANEDYTSRHYCGIHMLLDGSRAIERLPIFLALEKQLNESHSNAVGVLRVYRITQSATHFHHQFTLVFIKDFSFTITIIMFLMNILATIVGI